MRARRVQPRPCPASGIRPAGGLSRRLAAYEAKSTVAARLGAEILPNNKQQLFDALAAAGIDFLTVAFDGYGHSGQFEAPAGFDVDNNEVEVPNMPITIKAADFNTSTVGERTTTVQEFIEHLACDFLEGSYSGWEDGKGSHGDGGGLVLDLAKRETVASIDCADWLAHQLTDPGELAGHR
jgi:hypothetical protein